MRRAPLVLIALLICGAAVGACGGDDDGGDSATSTPTAQATATIEGNASPVASPGARTDAPKEDGYSAQQVFPQADFDQMLLMKQIPGDERHALVVSQAGTIYRVSLDTDEAAPFLDVSDRMLRIRGMEEGLLGLAFAPDYATSGHFYVYYSAGPPRHSVIARYTATGDTADHESEQIVLEVPQPFANHNGGALEFGPDGMLYIALGDGGSGGDPLGNGQNPNELLGSILRIDVSTQPYSIPPDNPFANGGGAPEVFAYGLRNPWRFTFDTKTNDIWVADVGQNQIEEVEKIEKGGNYGWSIMEGDACYNAATCDRTGLILPRAQYTHADGCSVTGGYVYHGTAMPELEGWYVYGDFCSGIVWAVDTASDSSPPVRLMDTGKPISAFAQTDDGEVYMVTFANAIYSIVRK
jgi:glucose/arabinose dehydrogenase